MGIVSRTQVIEKQKEVIGFFPRLFSYNIDITILMVVFVVVSFTTQNDKLLYSLCIGITTLYFSVLESSEWQGTIGKKYNKIKVVDAEGKRISFLLAFLRTLLKFISLLLLIFAILIIYLRRDRKSFHDIILKTSVIKI
ncbi:MAG: putative RDD family membrane protein YckC [Bacteroidia bacterium]|jgi:uncharacterized RDD family membrane protein YckC